MRSFKNNLLISLAAAQMFLCAACGGSSGSGSSSSSSNKDAVDQVSGSSASNSDTDTSATESAAKKDDVVVTLGLMCESEDPLLNDAIRDFNNADNGCHIEIKLMSSRYDDEGHGVDYTEDDLRAIDFSTLQTLMNDSGIDIVGGQTFFDDAKFELLKQKGAFADLYDFMENDPEVNTSTLNQHILELNELDGELYNIPQFYVVRTIISPSEYGGTTENWTIDEFIDRWNEMPDGATIEGSNCAEYIFYNLLRQNLPAFVDEENVEVHFDSDDFRKMLEFCKQFPSNNGGKADYNFNAPMMTKNLIINCVGNSIITDINPLTYEETNYRLRDGSYTLVGYPTSDRKGAYLTSTTCGWAICRNSSDEKKEAAWKFIRQFYTEEYQTENGVMQYEYVDENGNKIVNYYAEREGFCINNAARKKIAENTLNGMYDNKDEVRTAQGHEITIVDELKLDEQDVEFIENYVESIERWDNDVDRELFWIVNDEVLSYLGGGQDIDTTIALIQDRASIWLSEIS